MKHFRDLVLSTKEPTLHNVLWIKPVGLLKYKVFMYEDGWQPLFGGDSEYDSGLNYTILNKLPDGYVIQLIDNSNPDDVKNLYPKTRANVVYMSNGIDVETTINNINSALANINSNIKQAIFISSDNFDQQTNLTGKTFFIYTNYDADTDTYTGDIFLRKYVSERKFNREILKIGDIVMDIGNKSKTLASRRLTEVNEVDSARAILLGYVTRAILNNTITKSDNKYVQDVQVDNKSVVVNNRNKKVAKISEKIKHVYMINYRNLDTYYSGQKTGKTFFFRNEENNSGVLHYYTSETEYTDITLKLGDILYNLDQHLDFEPFFYAVIREGTYPETVQLLMSSHYTLTYIYDAIANYDEKFAHLDYVNKNGNVYKKLKYGEEQMCVLKSMGMKLDGSPTYMDYNDDGVIDHTDYTILSSLLVEGSIEVDGTTYRASGTTLYINDELNVDKILDLNQDSYFTGSDVTYFTNYLLFSGKSGTEGDTEFVGNNVIFAVFDPNVNKIKIGYDYRKYIEQGDNYLFLTVDPSPNVIYCNCYNNKLYRWNTRSSKMVELNTENKLDKTIFTGNADPLSTNPHGESVYGVTFTNNNSPENINKVDQMYLTLSGDTTIADMRTKKWYIPIHHGDIYSHVKLYCDILNAGTTTVLNTNALLLFFYNSEQNRLRGFILNNPQNV